MNQKELNKILSEHKKWVLGKGGARANLKEIDLRGVDLYGADLREVNFRRADLSEADLRGADLSGADLRGADLSEADFRGADLSNANLINTHLYLTDFNGANLIGADLFEEGVRSQKITQIHGLYYYVCLLDSHIRIGCKLHTVKEWENFSDEEIDRMHNNTALPFWKKNKEFILGFYKR